MTDEFDIVDIVFKATEAAATELIGCKGNSAAGEKNDHYTVNTTGVNTLRCVNKAPVVNVNVFIKRYTNGMPNLPKMKEVVRKMRASLKIIEAPAGMYWKSKIVWSKPMGEAKDGFDCTNIRLEVITEK